MISTRSKFLLSNFLSNFLSSHFLLSNFSSSIFLSSNFLSSEILVIRCLIFVSSVIDSLSQSFLINSVSALSKEGLIFYSWARRVRIRTRIGGLIEGKPIILKNLVGTQLGHNVMCMESCDIRSVVRWRRWRMGILKNDAMVGIRLVRLNEPPGMGLCSSSFKTSTIYISN